jgi:DeoR/GlpR family transcriptional regulator of sugar metabolism
MIEQSSRLTIVADGSKIGATTMASVAPANVINTLVTDSSAPAAELRALERLGVDVVVLDESLAAEPAGSGDASAA